MIELGSLQIGRQSYPKSPIQPEEKDTKLVIDIYVTDKPLWAAAV